MTPSWPGLMSSAAINSSPVRVPERRSSCASDQATRISLRRLSKHFRRWSAQSPLWVNGHVSPRSWKMQVVTQIGTSRDFQLKQAILIYEDQVSQREKFATVHQVTSQGPDQQASLEPGTLLTTSFLERLTHGLQRAPRAVLLPEN